jgi:AcrR family transcriptional regulator
MTVQTYHHGNLRATLLDSAEQVVARSGTHRLSLREIARLAGVSHGAPRAHFPTKEALLDAVAQRGFERLHAQLGAAASGPAEAFVERVHAVSASYVDFALNNGPLLELMFSAGRAQRTPALVHAESRTYAVFSDMLVEGQRQGQLLDGTADDIGLPFFAAIHGIAVLLSSGTLPVQEKDRIVLNTSQIALRGIRSTGSEAGKRQP